jgi:hypothetical protein
VLLLDLAFAHRSRQQDIANQKARSLIKTDNRVGRIIWERIERQNLFEMCKAGSVKSANTPRLFEMRL